MAVSQSLKLTEVSYNESDNTSKVRILWQSTQTGESRNEYTRTAYYYVSINGGAETKYSVSYTLPRGTTKTIVDSTITVNHRSDGTGTVAVRTWMDTDISAGVVELDDTIELTKIGRASIITSASAVVLGEQSTTIKWTPASSFHAYKIVLKIGAWGWTSEMISPRRTTEYAWKSPVLSLDLASEIPGDTRNGEMEAILYTFESASSTAIIGSSSKLFSVTVPKDSLTIPTARLTIQPVNSLRAPFDSMYLQGFSKVQAEISGEGKYGATITGYSLYVGGVDYSEPYTSEVLHGSGEVLVVGTAIDSRGGYGYARETINVIPYSKPRVVPASGEGSIVCTRCDQYGQPSDGGTYLLIKAGRSYSTVTTDGVQNNFCEIRYRYKTESATSFSAWHTLLADEDISTNSFTSSPISGVVSSVSTAYVVEIGVVDSIGESTAASVTFKIPTDTVSWDIPEKLKGKRIGVLRYAKDTDEPGIDLGAPVYGGALDSLKLGEELEGDSLDGYLTAGVYYSPSSEASRQIANAPTTESGFRLEVREVEGEALVRHTAFYGSSIAVRHYNGTKWSAWSYFLSTASPKAVAADFVVEQGISGNWVYEKWNSGIAKLWGSGNASFENGNVLSAEMVYPFTLTSAVSGIGSINSYGGNAASALPWNVKLAYGSANCKAWIHNSGGGFTSASSIAVSVCIVGKWK